MNKSNAHLYLPLVQALAEGKDIQMKGPHGDWRDQITDNGFNWDYPPGNYRIKPLEWPPIPEGCSLHNPDGLTPEQVGDGWRLLVAKEYPSGEQVPNSRIWQKYEKCWHENRGLWYFTSEHTLSVPISTPFPDGSKIVDGKLVKPWVPKFTAGQRVKVIASTYDTVEETEERIGQEATVIEDTKTAVDVRFGDNARWSYAQSDLELTPWSLTRHIPEFRPLRDGEEWVHLDWWKEEDLPEERRPLLTSEYPKVGDEYRVRNGAWCNVGEDDRETAGSQVKVIHRTRRPLPEPKKQVPLGPSDWLKDGPWWIERFGTDFDARLVTKVSHHGIGGDGFDMSHEEAATLKRSNDGINWQPCSKEAP